LVLCQVNTETEEELGNSLAPAIDSPYPKDFCNVAVCFAMILAKKGISKSLFAMAGDREDALTLCAQWGLMEWRTRKDIFCITFKPAGWGGIMKNSFFLKILSVAFLLFLQGCYVANEKRHIDYIDGVYEPPPIAFQGYPHVVVIPETTYVYGVPDIQADLFFWNGYWWRPWMGRWYRSRYHERGWNYYSGVPGFYHTVNPRWKEYYRARNWQGNRWNYERIPSQRLHQSWEKWQKDRYWEKERSWGIQNPQTKPVNQRQEIRQDRQRQIQARQPVLPQGQRNHKQPLNQRPQFQPSQQQQRERFPGPRTPAIKERENLPRVRQPEVGPRMDKDREGRRRNQPPQQPVRDREARPTPSNRGPKPGRNGTRIGPPSQPQKSQEPAGHQRIAPYDTQGDRSPPHRPESGFQNKSAQKQSPPRHSRGTSKNRQSETRGEIEGNSRFQHRFKKGR